MKKQILQLIIVLCCIIAMPLATFGTTFSVNSLEYTINDDETTVSITGYTTKPTGKLVLPNTVTDEGNNTYTVTAIADGYSSTGVFY